MNTDHTLICKLHNYTNIIIEGKDTIRFLQGQLSCDMDKITANQNGYGAYCNTKGRVLSFFDVLQVGEKVILNLPSSVADKMVSTLKKYAIFSKVSIIQDETLSTLGVYGKNSINWMNNFLGSSPIEQNKLSNKNGVIVYKLITIAPAFKIIGSSEVLLDKITKQIGSTNINSNTIKWKHFLMTQTLPEITSDSSELFLPAELGLDKTDAISFTKGCFMGQEIVARMKYIGSMKKALKQIEIKQQGNLSIKEKILCENKNVGEIVDFVALDQQTFYALALISNNVNMGSDILTTANGGKICLA